MPANRDLHDLGQSLWLDNITRELLDGGTLARYVDELSVTGLTSNPTIFDQALKLPADGSDCEAVIARFAQPGVDVGALAARLQDESAQAFVKSWNELLAVLDAQCEALRG